MRATYDDLIAVPEHLIAEIIDGELVTSRRWHPGVVSHLLMIIGAPYHRGRDGPGTWWILHRPELHFGDDVLVPRMAGWRKERMPQLPDGHAYVTPDWICEVIAHETAHIDRMENSRFMRGEGVAYEWLVEPDAQTVEIKRLENGLWVDIAGYGGDDKFRAEPFELVEIDLAEIW